MVKSMYAAVAGLKAHQSKMDVIGNNIANVNTWGYKAMTASFKESMYQKITDGSAGSTNDGSYGATNPTMLGYGSMVSAISANFTKGSPAPTDRGLDLFIDGNTFFMVGPIYGEGEEKSPKDVYMSRVGDFEVRNGYLVDSNGRYVYGCGMAAGGAIRTIEDTSTEKTDLAGLNFKHETTQVVATKITLDDEFTDADLFNQQYGYGKDYIASDGKTYKIMKSEYDPITKKGSFIYADKGTPVPEDLTSGKDVEYEYKTGKKGKLLSVKTSMSVPYITIEYSTAPKVGDMYTAPDGTKGKIMTIDDTDPSKVSLSYAKITATNTTYEGPAIDNMDFDSATGGYTLGETESLKPIKIPETCQYWDEEKQTYVTENNIVLNQYSIDKNGMIHGTSSTTGKEYILGCVALVNVTNPNGMVKTDGPYYQVSSSAGEAQIVAPGGQNGSLVSGYLEMANVDIANEFSTMITTQRGFQANSKIISVTDEMLQELVNMKR